jgi:hypothetical protein
MAMPSGIPKEKYPKLLRNSGQEGGHLNRQTKMCRTCADISQGDHTQGPGENLTAEHMEKLKYEYFEY